MRERKRAGEGKRTGAQGTAGMGTRGRGRGRGGRGGGGGREDEGEESRTKREVEFEHVMLKLCGARVKNDLESFLA